MSAGKTDELTRVNERSSRAWHISQDAIDVCNGYDLDPSDLIVFLAGEVRVNKEKRELRLMIEDAVKRITQIEGVILKKEQKADLGGALNDILLELRKMQGNA